ncbi:MAG: hypothetical protein PF517_15285 [Salinivirgaceae bacterium]|jgi:hypothetical protein|nr:hypothetical protein [Salinivirgaceae bacterium]
MSNYFKYTVILLILFFAVSFCTRPQKRTVVEIKGAQFYINGELTYKGKTWQGNNVEGLLMNSRMVQGIFDDLNPETSMNFKYPDTGEWNADRNTAEFVASMQDWYNHGLLAFTLNLQGGSPMGYGNNGWVNSCYNPQGNLRPEYLKRLKLILDKADELGMVVILGYFYFGQDEHLSDERAVVNAVDNITTWIIENGYRNIIVEIANECDIFYDHDILKPELIVRLIERVQNAGEGNYKLLVSTSYSGGNIPRPNVVKQADFLLLHGNGVNHPKGISDMVQRTKNVQGFTPKPILFNEDDHYEFEKDTNNFVNAIRSYASWGYFDFRHEGESFENGFQSIPADWSISSERKIAFFNKLKEITKD